MIIIVAGTIGRSVTGGQTWANLHYLLGLRALGHDVYYLEDVGPWSVTYDWQNQCNTSSLDYPADYIERALAVHGFAEKWIYRTSDESRGMSLERLYGLCEEADLLLIRGVPMLVWRREYDAPGHRAFIDVDPGFTQIRLANREQALAENVARCETLFTYGTRIGRPDCTIPTVARVWHATVPPIDLDAWPLESPRADGPLTMIVRWRGVHDVQYNGIRYGQRDKEFPKFLSLPRETGARFQVALIGEGKELLEAHGWEVVDGGQVTKDLEAYRKIIAESSGEFGVAKNCYVETRGGWISDRSASFLAAGRPVVIQDTGVSEWLPVGTGVLTFRSFGEAMAAVADLIAGYERHALEARHIAETYFDSQRVLRKLLSDAGVSTVKAVAPIDEV